MWNGSLSQFQNFKLIPPMLNRDGFVGPGLFKLNAHTKLIYAESAAQKSAFNLDSP